MITNYTHIASQFGKAKILSLALSFIVVSSTFAQDHNHAHCISEQEVTCKKDVESAFEQLKNDNSFKQSFYSRFNVNYSDFIAWNAYEKNTFIGYISNDICYNNKSLNTVGSTLLELIARTKDNYWFEKPVLTGDSDLTQVGKYVFLEKGPGKETGKESGPQNIPKTAACLNADFEMGNHTGWNLFCGTVTGTVMGGTTGEGTNCGTQHAIVTGGADAYTGSPRVFQGGNSAMLGDGTGTGARYARLRKDFVVSASNPAITYSYMAVLQDPGGGHANAERPFFSARVYVGGSEVGCAQYFSHFGDGQAGWVTGGGVAYRDWTSIFVPLETYIGQTVTLEVTVGDCSQTGHWGYAYVDVSCENMEVDQFCQGSSTVLSAPSQGIQAYEWSTGETTQQITITTPGLYTVNILPYGSICSATLTYNASIYPAPTADFSISASPICIGGDVDFTNQSTVESGGTITGYQWNFGDGISTPNGMGNISGVPQTTGTYTTPNHIYNTLGDFNITLTMETSDGCSASSQVPISVIEGPEATIAGDTAVCNGDGPPEVTFTGSLTPGPYTFSYNINNGPTQYVSTSPGNSSVTVPVPTAPPGTYVYNLTYITDSSTAQCERPQQGSVQIVVNPLPAATIATSAVVCQGAAEPVITFTGSNGVPNTNYEFAYSVNGGAIQTIASTGGSSTVTIDQPTDVADTFVYVLHTVTDLSTTCSDTVTGALSTSTIVVNPMPDATISGSTVVCQNDGQPVITFTGSNSYGDYDFVYSINGGTSQTLSVSGTTTGTVNVPTNVADTFVYELISVSDPLSGCEQLINETQTVIVNPLPTATIQGTTTICQDAASPQITFTGNGGTSDYEFTYSINGGVPQTVTTSGSSSVTVNVPTSVATSYTYTLHSVRDVATNCAQNQTGSATVLINPRPVPAASGTVTVCQGSTPPVITFTGYNSTTEYAFSYNVNNGPLQTVTSSGSNVVTLTQPTTFPGTYVYELTNVMDPATLCNRDTSILVTITVKPLPTATVSNPVEACYLDPQLPVVTFTGQGGEPPYTFAYNINGGATQYVTSTNDIATIQVPTNTVGEFIYTITNIQDGSIEGCNQALNISTMVTINPLPDVDAGDDFTVCAGTTIVLTGSGAQSYTWDNNVTNGVPFTATQTTVYTVEGTDHNNCVNTDQITVTVIPIPEMDIIGQNLSGCAPVIPVLTNNSTGNLTNCTWYLGNGEVLQGCGSVSSVFNSPGCFDVTLVVSTPEGCTNQLTLDDYICVDPQPVADFYPNPSELTTYNWESQMVNESVGAINYQWDFGDGTGYSYAHSPTHAFPNDVGGIYTVTLVASTDNGCVDTAYAIVTVKEELIFYVPNTFTPDNDDYNETFKPVFTTGFDPYNYTLYVFNRWGELIFESHDTNIGWNGKYGVDGKLCQDGTYTWKINVKKRMVDEHLEFVGHVNLIR